MLTLNNPEDLLEDKLDIANYNTANQLLPQEGLILTNTGKLN